jgi:predicted transcriptional regulator
MNRNPAGILTVRELDLMNVLWEYGPQRVSDVQSRLATPLAHTTIGALLNTLEVKGCVRRTVDGKAHLFTARVSHAVVARASIRYVKYRLLAGCAATLFELVVEESTRDGHHQALRRVRRMVDRRVVRG